MQCFWEYGLRCKRSTVDDAHICDTRLAIDGAPHRTAAGGKRAIRRTAFVGNEGSSVKYVGGSCSIAGTVEGGNSAASAAERTTWAPSGAGGLS